MRLHNSGPLEGEKPREAHPTYQSVCIGSVQVKVEVPTTAEVQKRLKESQAVVKGIGRALNKRGVKLDLKATTPTFSSDPKQPHLVIRKLGKIVTRGEFKNGKFVEVA